MAAIGAVVEPLITRLTYLAGTVLLKVADAMVWVVEKGTVLIAKIKEIKDKGVQFFIQFKTGVENTMDQIVSGVISRVNSIISWVQNAIAALRELFSMQASSASTSSTTTSTSTSASVSKHAAGGILTKPTIFGYTPATNTYHLGGEAGAEAIAPIDVLQGYVRSAVADGMKSSVNDKVTGLLEQMVELLQISAAGNTRIEINGREFGRMVKEYA